MKKTAIRIIAVLIIATMFLTLLAACRSETEGNDFIFIPEFVTLPEEINDVQNLTFSNNLLYFTSYVILNEESYETELRFYSMNLDGTNITVLSDYSPLKHENPDASGGTGINGMTVDPEGNIWLLETGNFYIDNTPEDFDGDPWDAWQLYHEDLGNIMKLRKLDSTGAEILSVDLTHITGENSHVNTFALDGDGNLFLGTYSFGASDMKHEILVLNNNGELQFKIEAGNWIDSLVRLPDGAVAFLGWEEGVNGHSQVLRKIDYAARDWGETVDLPRNVWNLYPGGGDYIMFYQDQNNLRGIKADSDETVKLINWIESGIIPGGLGNIIMLPDGRIACINRNYSSNMFGHEMTTDLILFNKIPISELPERIELTLAAAWLSWELREVIVNFNRTSQQYRLKVIDYSEFNSEDDWNAGLTRLSTDIIAGNIPDILDLNGLPFHQYVARDILLDFYPLIDSDRELNRSDFIESVFKAAEINGGLYRAFASFEISTMLGSPKVLGPYPGWTMTEFIEVLNANPQADIPLGEYITRDQFLMASVYININQYINWGTGEVNFDNPDFIKLLEFSTRFPAEYNYSDDGVYVEESQMIAEGRQIIVPGWISEFAGVRNYLQTFGGEIVFKGFPNENRTGNSLDISTGVAITTSCSNVDGAWEFIRTILTQEWQRNNISWRFPTNKAVFNEMAENALKESEDQQDGFARVVSDSAVVRMPGMPYDPPPPLTQAHIDQVIALIDSVSGIVNYEETLMNIIMEGAADFYNGRSSAQDAARIIQSRVGIYIAEQS